MTDTCPAVVSFDIAQTAGLYSQLAGVLAGFAFAALFFLIGKEEAVLGAAGPVKRVLRLTVSSFLSLTLVSLNYGVLAGETTLSGRTAMVQLVAGPSFISAGVLVLISVHSLLRALDDQRQAHGRDSLGVAGLLRVTASLWLPPVLMLSLYGGIDDYADVKYPERGFWWLDIVGLCLVAGVLVIPALAYRPAWGYLNDQREDRAISRSSTAAVCITLASTAAVFVFSSELTPCQTLDEWVVLVVITVPAVFLSAVSVHLVRTRRTG